MMIRKYDSTAFIRFQKEALESKGGRLQVEILTNARKKGGGEFILWLEAQMRPAGTSVFEGDKELPIPDKPEKFTAQECINFPRETASALWEEWKGESCGIFCSIALWGYITSRFVKEERIRPCWLMASSSGSQSTGEAEIDKALGEKDPEKRNKAIDGCVRTFLRRLSGLQARGARSLYHDCPIAAAWWQHYIAEDVASATGKGEYKDDILVLLRENSALWADLTEKMASKLTVIGDKNIRAGIILFLLEMPEAKGHLGKIIKDIGVMSGWRALGMFEPAEIRGIIADEIYPSISQEERQ